ncbi:MAG TPA: SRPBCC family protein [Steroidobacteraceae bacterium]|nr:SRPBCC family protein [Steroidobacteraceae bacterium]
MPAPAERAWALLQDIERVAACMPGARITERIDPQHYKGTVAVRFGPANLSFRGDLELAAIEPATRTLRLLGKGTDTSGGSGASLDLTGRIDAVDATSCTLTGRSEMSLSGRVATFGGRMAEAVADQVLRQFAANFSAALEKPATPNASAPASETVTAAPASETATAASPAAVQQTPLNGLALLWAIVRGWLRGLLGGRNA